jgi:hypothetical protein
MKIIILGATTEQKGAELERFAKKIFERSGFVNAVTNVVASGANEYDVTSECIIKKRNKEVRVPIIAECKAYSYKCDMNQWLKFLGKLHTIQLDNKDAEGYFFALSDVNGNVWGAFNEYHTKDKKVHLIAKDELMKLLSKEFKLSDTPTIQSTVSRFTNKSIDDVDLIFTDNKVYWLIQFNSLEYTILDSENCPITDEEFVKIESELPSEYRYASFVNLEQERDGILRKKKLEGCLFSLAICNQANTRAEITEFLTQNNLPFTVDEVEGIAHSVRYLSKKYPFTIKPKGNLCDFYEYIFSLPFYIQVFKSAIYQENINNKLIKDILKKQGGLVLPKSEVGKVIQMLKLSFSALRYAIEPDNFIVNSISNSQKFPQWQIANPVMKLAVARFFSNILDFVNIDFTRQEYHETMMTLLDISSYSFSRKLTINKGKANEIEIDVSPQVYLGQVTNVPGGPIVSVVKFEDVD